MKRNLLLAALAIGTIGVSVAQDARVFSFDAAKQARQVVSVTGAKQVNPNVMNKVSAKPATKGVALKAAVAPRAEGDATVSYSRPTSFNTGFTDVTSPYYTFYLMPMGVDLTWTNTSTGISGNNYSWSYSLSLNEGEPVLTSTNKDLTIENMPYTMMDSPILNVNGTQYQDNGLVLGGGTQLTLMDKTDKYFSEAASTMTNLEEMLGWTSLDAVGKSTLVQGEKITYDNVVDFWNDTYFAKKSYKATALPAFGVYFPQFDAPYAISKIYMSAVGEWKAGAEFTLNVYKCSLSEADAPDPNSLKLIATATTVDNDGYNSTDYQKFLTFNLQTVPEGELDLPREGYITIDSPIYIEVSGFEDNQNVTTFNPAYWIDMSVLGTEQGDAIAFDEDFTTYDVIRFNIKTNDDQEGFMLLPYPFVTGWKVDSGVAWCPVHNFNFNADAVFNWLQMTADGETIAESTTVPVAGGDSEELIYSSFPSQGLFDTAGIDGDADGDGVLDAYTWLSYEITEGTYDAATSEGNYPYITFTADPLPSGTEGRYATVELSIAGATPVEFIVTQGTTGVEGVVATSAAQVSVVGGNFVVSAPESINAVTVYNVAGQAVATSEIAGNTTVDASSLAKGVYVLRFNDGSTVKVIK